MSRVTVFLTSRSPSRAMSCVAILLTLLCWRFLDIAVAEDLGAVHAARAASSHSIRAIAMRGRTVGARVRARRADGAPRVRFGRRGDAGRRTNRRASLGNKEGNVMTRSVALYARVSSQRQAQQATIESQLAALRARAAQDQCLVLPGDEYIDNGHSGSSLRRPALERLRDRVAQGAVDTIYVHSPDRLARRHAHQVLLLEEFARYGARVTMIEGRSGDSAEDQLLIQVQGVIAEYERAKIMERSRRGKLHKARTGSINVMSNAPYGYRYIKKSDGAPAHYQVVLHEARVVRRIFEAVVRKQKSLRGVARMLDEEGVPPRREPKKGQTARWRANAIYSVLRNPSYMGLAAFGRTERVERSAPLRAVLGRAA